MESILGKQYHKKIDSIVAMILFFIFLVVILFILIVRINLNIEKHISNDTNINKLKLINKEFDTFLLKKNVNFTNYDLINKKISEFENILDTLKSQKYTKTKNSYIKLLENIEQSYQIKHTLIEYHKSKNALLLNSIHYLFELSDTISKTPNITKEDATLVRKTLLLFMKFYVNPYVDISEIFKNIEKLKRISEKTHTSKLKMFNGYILIDIKQFQNFQKLRNDEKKNMLSISIENLHKYLQIQYEKDISEGRLIAFVVFLIVFLTLIKLLLMYKHSLKLKNKFAGFIAAVENSDNSIIITDTDGVITYANDMTLKETQYSKDELVGQHSRILKSGKKSEAFYKKIYDTLASGKKWKGEFINKRKDGSEFYEKASIVPIFQNHDIVNYLAIKLNITDYILEKQKVERMAYHDTLTSLPNRTNLEKYLQRQLYIAKRENYKLAVLFIDLDRFKTINDTLGHDVGDKLLIACSGRIKNILRESDMLARIGGDEFVIVLDVISSEHYVAKVCEMIIESFQQPIEIENYTLNITLSIGVSFYPDDGKDIISLFKYADVAMYEAKENGRNNFKYYKDQLSIDAHNRLDMEQSLKQALENNEFYLKYQPKYNMLTKEIIGLEALVRWKSGYMGFVTPDKFIAMAEEIGDILELGKFIFKRACEDFSTFKQHCPSLKTISINVSAVQLYQESFIETIRTLAKDTGVDPSSIMLEITESYIMKNVEYSMEILQKLKEYNFKISIDDFGTGYSSLSYLKQLPVDEVKIDKSFIDELPENKDDVVISKAIIALCKNMGYKNVAEGIETQEQEDFLAQNGCDIGQGFYFCKPKRKDKLLEFFDNYLKT